MSKPITVKEIWVYPIKSCKGIQMQESAIDEFGFKYDRKWMVVSKKILLDARNFHSIRDTPKLLNISPSFASPSDSSLPDSCKDGEYIRLDAPEMPPIFLKTSDECQVKRNTYDVKLFKELVTIEEEPEEISQWFSDFLKKEVILVRRTNSITRQVCKREPEGDYINRVGLSDLSPFMITSTTTLDYLKEKIKKVHEKIDKSDQPIQEMSMRRFRPNIVLDNMPNPMQEEQIDTLTFHLTHSTTPILHMKKVTPCIRCKVPMVDPDLAKIDGPEPTRTLVSDEYGIDGIAKPEPVFGVQVVHDVLEGVIRVGDTVEVQ